MNLAAKCSFRLFLKSRGMGRQPKHKCSPVTCTRPHRTHKFFFNVEVLGKFRNPSGNVMLLCLVEKARKWMCIV